MKKACLFILLVCTLQVGYGQLTSHVDERFELTSIAARLAQYEEYNDCRVTAYAADIDQYFSPYKQHPLIAFLQEVRYSNSIAYNAISSAANAMEISGGKIRIQPRYNLKKRSDVETIDERWDEGTLVRFIKLLNDFYRKSNFARFYRQHVDLYAIATHRMDSVLSKINTKWFEEFYGEPFGSPKVYVSLSNGQHNYALTDDKRTSSEGGENEYGILIGTHSDGKGLPRYNSVYNTIIHEFNHNFANPLAFEFESQMNDAVDRIFPHVENSLRDAAYSKEAILPEWLTRMATLMYCEENRPMFVQNQIGRDIYLGFIWQQRAFDFMTNFSNNRDQYHHFKNFIPQLVAFLNYTADNIDKVVFEYENRHPYVVNVYPAPGSELDLTKDVTEFVFTFSEPMNTGVKGMNFNGNNLEVFRSIPSDELSDWVMDGWIDDRSFVIRLKSQLVKTGEITGITLFADFIQKKQSHFSPISDITVEYSNFKKK